jgi:hypothetical protein
LPAQGNPAPAAGTSDGGFVVDTLFNYLNMAGAKTAKDFRPLTQRERDRLYVKSIFNPFVGIKALASAGINQWVNTPVEWGQGASAYAKRTGNLVAQYEIQRTIAFGVASGLREDNRYFGSGEQGAWRRVGYAMSSSILARHDDGRRYLSVSTLASYAGAAFISLAWQPPSTSSAASGAKSFGISMGGNLGTCVLKEFVPDIGRWLKKKKVHPTTPPDPAAAKTGH